jgi:hypothetical protein
MLDGRKFDIDVAKSFVKMMKNVFETLVAPTREAEVILGTIWKVPTDKLMERFGHLSRNIVVIGDKRTTVCYCKHMMMYTTGLTTGVYRWNELLNHVESTIKLNCSIGATIKVFHHKEGFLGEVMKKKGPGSFFVPLGIVSVHPGCRLPDDWKIGAVDGGAVEISGWSSVKKKLMCMFND